MAPTKSNEENDCCLNLCNTFWMVALMYFPGGIPQLCCNLCGSYDCAWLWIRGMQLEPPYVTSWNRLVNSKPGGPAVFGQILPRIKPIDYAAFYNTRTTALGVDFGGQLVKPNVPWPKV